MFRKILIANRGEIAVRVARACRALGVRSAAVYSEADADALHVRTADEAHACGPPPARESYLDAERLVAIAVRCGADAVHPGYGFLSESGEFADRCAAAGLAFIGPDGDVLRVAGDKLASRRAAAAAGVPVIPGSDRALDDAATLDRARALGFPLMLKATAGGGGRGLRRVEDEAALRDALPRARREAGAAFGHDAVYLERCVDRPRHVEVQVLADGRGRVAHLFERDCTTQRRHQKLVEEAPAPGLPAALRDALADAAVRVSRHVGYRGAGTCEFLVSPDGAFHFLEINPRIQVEHPVTEAVTGVDLVEAMIRIAAGEPWPLPDEGVRLRGHAIEARIYAEDPDRRFLPSPGVLERFDPPEGEGLRVDAGVVAGDRIGVHYDPLIAKLIAWGADREAAVARLDDGLARFAIEGIRTTIGFQRRVLADARFREARHDTSFAESLAGGRPRG